MRILEEMLSFNHEFVKKTAKRFAHNLPSKIPSRELAIFTCMDTRLVNFLLPAIGVKRGEAKVIQNAGNTLSGPLCATIRSFIVSIFELGVKEIVVIGHLDCGLSKLTFPHLVEKMISRGISPHALKMVEKELADWVDQFQDPVHNVIEVVEKIRNHPLIPKDVSVHGLMFNPYTGQLGVVIDGYDAVTDIEVVNG